MDLRPLAPERLGSVVVRQGCSHALVPRSFPHCHSTPGRLAAIRPIMSTPKFLSRLPQLSIFALGGLLSAQAPASYTLYGEGCNGAPLSHCLTLNDQNPVMTVASLWGRSVARARYGIAPQ